MAHAPPRGALRPQRDMAARVGPARADIQARGAVTTPAGIGTRRARPRRAPPFNAVPRRAYILPPAASRRRGSAFCGVRRLRSYPARRRTRYMAWSAYASSLIRRSFRSMSIASSTAP